MMECSYEIDVDIDDGDSCDFFNASIVRARKQHKCSECRRIIESGTEYEYARGCWGGDFQVYKTCPDCLSLRKEFFTGGYFFSRIWEDFEIHVDEVGASISETCLSNLTPVARGKACDIIQAWWDEDDAEMDDMY